MNEDDNQASQSELINRLATIPARITRAVASWNIQQIQEAPISGEWTARDILAHLRAADDILTSRMYMLLVRDNPPCSNFNERRWAEIAGYTSHNFHNSLTVFTLRRAEVVSMLQHLPSAAWYRSGTHETRGIISLQSIVEDLVKHEEEHCVQLEKFALFQV